MIAATLSPGCYLALDLSGRATLLTRLEGFDGVLLYLAQCMLIWPNLSAPVYAPKKHLRSTTFTLPLKQVAWRSVLKPTKLEDCAPRKGLSSQGEKRRCL